MKASKSEKKIDLEDVLINAGIMLFAVIPAVVVITLGLWEQNDTGLGIAIFAAGMLMVIRHDTQKWLGTATSFTYSVFIGTGLWMHNFLLVACGLAVAGAWEIILRTQKRRSQEETV